MPPYERERLIVGDVHGCADELDALLESVSYDPARHEIWFTGDLVNRGPSSLEVLRRAVAIDAGSVLGNHDLHALGVAAGDRAARRRDTLDALSSAPDRDDLLDWLRTRPLLQTWPDLVLVHAGLHPAWTDAGGLSNADGASHGTGAASASRAGIAARRLETRIRRGDVPWDDEDLAFFTRVRHCSASGVRPHDDVDPPDGFAPWDAWYRGATRVVFGHWAMRGLVRTERVVGLDTGCVWGGALSAWLVDEDRVVSVPARRVYQTIP